MSSIFVQIQYIPFLNPFLYIMSSARIYMLQVVSSCLLIDWEILPYI